jgi:branched-chain amino acid transport system ATP-binding protein
VTERAVTISDLVVVRGGREILHGVDLQIRPSAITALLGANGAGKSTLVAAVAGLLPVASGEVNLDGRSCLGLAPDGVRRNGLSIVPEGHRVLGNLTVEDNLRLAGLDLSATDYRIESERIATLFPEIVRHRSHPASTLSGGQKQMVSIAQAILARPAYMIVDELSLGLAPTVVQRLGRVLSEIAAGGVGILLIEQFTTLALQLAQSAFIMERGQIVFSGASDILLENPEILQRAYLGG